MSYMTSTELLAVGFSRVGQDCRVSRSVRFHEISGILGNDVRIDDFSILTGDLTLGGGVHISPFCFLSGVGGGIVIGEHAGLGPGTKILTKSDNYSDRRHVDKSKVGGEVRIGAETIIGANVVILPGSTVGTAVAVGAGCIIRDSIPDGTRVISSHFEVRVSDLTDVSSQTVRCDSCLHWVEELLRSNGRANHGSQIDSLEFVQLLEALYCLDPELGAKAECVALASAPKVLALQLHDLGLCSTMSASCAFERN